MSVASVVFEPTLAIELLTPIAQLIPKMVQSFVV